MIAVVILPLLALGKDLFHPPLIPNPCQKLKTGETMQRLCHSSKENKEIPNANKVLIKSQAVLKIAQRSQSK